MKIIFILPEYYPHSGGGISTYYLHYIKALKCKVNKISVLVGSGYTQSDDVFNIDGVQIDYLKPEIFKRYKAKFSKFDLMPEYRNNIAASWAMWEQCNEGEGFDIIECTDFGLGFIPWLVNHKMPVVARLHGSAGQIDLHGGKIGSSLYGDLNRQAELLLLRNADRLITHSNTNKDYWKNILSTENLVLIYPIYNNDQVSIPFKEKENYGVVCGRIQEWKGPDVLCKAIAVMQHKPILKWYGRDTPFDQKTTKNQQLTKDFQNIWGEYILPQKSLPINEVIEIQKKAKFAIISSTWDMYNFTGLEYLNVETALICSDGAGVSELIVNGVNGYKYSKFNPLELADCIHKLLSLTEKEYTALVKGGKETILKKLDSNKLINQNIKVYEDILKIKIDLQVNEFIDELFKPSKKDYSVNNTLNNIPLKALIKYSFKRMLQKII